MRTLQRNKQEIWYALYLGVTNVVDSEGNYTGEQEVSYTAPIKARMNVSGDRGAAAVEEFGIDNLFTRTAVTDDMSVNFSTDTIFWFGITPGATAYAVPHNYRCTGVSRTINTLTLALVEVDVTHEPIVSG